MKVGIKLKIQIEGSKAKLESELMGIEDNQCLLIKMPPIYTVINASKFVYKGKAFLSDTRPRALCLVFKLT